MRKTAEARDDIEGRSHRQSSDRPDKLELTVWY